MSKRDWTPRNPPTVKVVSIGAVVEDNLYGIGVKFKINGKLTLLPDGRVPYRQKVHLASEIVKSPAYQQYLQHEEYIKIMEGTDLEDTVMLPRFGALDFAYIDLSRWKIDGDDGYVEVYREHR